MDMDAFLAALREEGFDQVVRVERGPSGVLPEHTHPFAARALILAGEITIVIDGRPERFGAGQVFHLAAHQPHAESYGPAGVKYLVGRKFAAG